MNRNKEYNMELPVINYYIIEKDRTLVNIIKKALSMERYRCLGVSVVPENVDNKVDKIDTIPDIFFVGNVKNDLEVIDNISRTYKKSRVLRIYSKSKIYKKNIPTNENIRQGNFLIL
ncbi:hypothetical protein [Mongoliibacter ruber]|uniref:Response regulatory domain-containing protein n=1 Tax=Mongoliibacter ruber TaxID=1750599 RepID=A0A2T0WDJ7_9BACT|nr:hypothetical protein [Mongoliibacter ruber]PRY84783.1 hypothetical protein CLW00_11760 [Mongoliibacter ruber]